MSVQEFFWLADSKRPRSSEPGGSLTDTEIAELKAMHERATGEPWQTR